MSHHCHTSGSHGSCTQSSCSSGDSHSSKCGCGCGCTNSHCQCACHQQCKYSDELLKLADDAWMELLKEKIKEDILQNAGDQLTRLAKLVSTANHARWKDKMQSKKDHEDFESQLKSVLCNQNKK